MNKPKAISNRISKVNQELQKLAGLIQNDHLLYSQTKDALQELHEEDSSSDSINYFELENQLAQSKGFNNAKIEVISNLSDEIESNQHGSTIKSGLTGIGCIKQSRIQVPQQYLNQNVDVNQSKTADVTVKKFRPLNPSSKKKQSKDKGKESSKLKNSKSDNKISMLSKTQVMNKSVKKREKQIKKMCQPYHVSPQMKGVYKKMKTSHKMKTNSQNRLNESLKMHINLKKQVNMKIIDLNIQKLQCQKEAEYLKSVMKIQQQEKLQSIKLFITATSQQEAVLVFMARLIVNFFSQFFSQKIVSENCQCEQLKQVLDRKNFLIKYMIKLPDILKKDNTLCEERCKRLFQQKYFIDHRIQSSQRSIQTDCLYIYVQSLHDYISFLINHNVVKETKRKALPIEFHSERSARAANTMTGNLNNFNLSANMSSAKERGDREYDSDRKGKKQSNCGNYNNFNVNANMKSKTTLKRANTQKILSPKAKIGKNTHSNNHSNVNGQPLNKEK